MTEFFQEFKRVMFEGNRFDFIIDGLVNTFVITLGSLIFGIILGVFVAIVRSTYDKNKSHLKKKGIKGVVLGVSSQNEKGINFYKKYGFRLLEETPDSLAFGIKLQETSK